MQRGVSLFALLALALAALLAAYPAIDLTVTGWFFDPSAATFPLAADHGWNAIRRIANWLPFLLLVPPAFALLRKLVFPSRKMLIAPTVAFYLLGSFLLGPGLTANLLLKENWGRPRPNGIEQFAGAAAFQPWWRPGGACKRNCSFVSGEASAAFWAVAPASLAPPQVRPLALGAAVTYGASVGALRVMFGRHFLSDIVFAGLITIAVVMALYRLLIAPLARADARIECGIERAATALHRVLGRARAPGRGAPGGAAAIATAGLGPLPGHLAQRQ